MFLPKILANFRKRKGDKGKFWGPNQHQTPPFLLWSTFYIRDCVLSNFYFLANYAIVGGQNQTLVLCKLTVTKKLADATPLRIFRGHERSVECVAANKDGSRIVSGSFDNCLKLWNSENGKIKKFSF